MGKGVGDLNIKAECMFLTKSYSISDLLLYADGSSASHFELAISSNGYLTVPNGQKIAIIPIDNEITLPSAFEISYIGQVNSNDGHWNLVMIGASADCNQYNIGMLNRGGFIRKGREGCTMTNLISNSNIYSNNTDVTVVYSYENGVHTLKLDNNTYTVTNTDYSMSKFFGIGCGYNAKMKELKIKPL